MVVKGALMMRGEVAALGCGVVGASIDAGASSAFAGVVSDVGAVNEAVSGEASIGWA